MMSALLAEVIAELHLKPGQSYRTTVNGHVVDIRMHDVSESALVQEEPSQFAEMVMVQPWFEIPESPGAVTLQVHPGPLDLPDCIFCPPTPT